MGQSPAEWPLRDGHEDRELTIVAPRSMQSRAIAEEPERDRAGNWAIFAPLSDKRGASERGWTTKEL
jgi:hypothetical protein